MYELITDPTDWRLRTELREAMDKIFNYIGDFTCTTISSLGGQRLSSEIGCGFLTSSGTWSGDMWTIGLFTIIVFSVAFGGGGFFWFGSSDWISLKTMT